MMESDVCREINPHWGDAMPNEMNDFIKFHTPSNLEIEFMLPDPASVYPFTIEKGNICLFETYV